jgi:hypothetical protein
MDSTKFMHMRLGAGHVTLAIRAVPEMKGDYVVGAAPEGLVLEEEGTANRRGTAHGREDLLPCESRGG